MELDIKTYELNVHTYICIHIYIFAIIYDLDLTLEWTIIFCKG
jgi:hypothetical protein